MVRVGQFMKKDLVCIESTQTVSVAANLMRRRGTGSLLVQRNSEIVGIVTEHDIVRKVVAIHRQPEYVHVEHIMSSPVLCIDETDSIFEAADIMRTRGTRHLAVGDEDHILGMLSARDLLTPVAKDEL